MSQIALTNEERQKALQLFGYSERNARFLCLAALHGGYFLRRQYDHFVGRPDRGTATQLIEKALGKGHVRAFTYRDQINIYHLCARPFYEALGQVDNRNRRLRQPFTIINKLMALDFVLAHPEHTFLAAEQEKLDYFAGVLTLDRSALPTVLYQSADGRTRTKRYFVDKYPIFFSATPGPASPLVISFCFVDEGLTTLSRFETYLHNYRGLFASLSAFQVVYVAATPARFEGAKRAFERFLKSIPNDKNGAADPEFARLPEYFEARLLYETKQFDSFDRARLIRLRNDQEEFFGEKIEALYEQWKAAGDSAILQDPAPKTVTPERICGTFSTYLLEHQYDLFGSLATS
jgi:hypothetical protein